MPGGHKYSKDGTFWRRGCEGEWDEYALYWGVVVGLLEVAHNLCRAALGRLPEYDA